MSLALDLDQELNTKNRCNSAIAARTGIAFIGCGFVADLYIATLSQVEDSIDLRGVFDLDTKRSASFGKRYGLEVYSELDALLADPTVEIVVNLTNPKHHYELSKKALEAGKHVYSEKPLAIALDNAQELAELSKAKGLQLVCAPSNSLGESAQTLMAAVRNQVVGKPRLVYAEIDDGMIHRIGMERWKSSTGVQWPATDELETGCTLEHAGYVLSWLVSMFGSATRVVSFSNLCVDDRGPSTPQNYSTPDFSCACVTFENGVVARITNSIIAPHNHWFRVFCDDGVIEVEEVWDFNSPVYATPLHDSVIKRQLHKRFGWTGRKKLKPLRKRKITSAPQGYNLDFMIGIADMAQAIREGSTPRLGGEFALHITEVSLAIQHPEIYGTDYEVKSSAPRVAPMTWAE